MFARINAHQVDPALTGEQPANIGLSLFLHKD